MMKHEMGRIVGYGCSKRCFIINLQIFKVYHKIKIPILLIY
jgi:hypothetical protein